MRFGIFDKYFKSAKSNHHRYRVGLSEHMGVVDVPEGYVMIRINSPTRYVFTSLTPEDATELAYALLAKANGGCQPED